MERLDRPVLREPGGRVSRTLQKIIEGAALTGLALSWLAALLGLVAYSMDPCPQDLLNESTGGGEVRGWSLLPFGPICAYPDGDGVDLIRLAPSWSVTAFAVSLLAGTGLAIAMRMGRGIMARTGPEPSPRDEP
jgi:hypothetical protein